MKIAITTSDGFTVDEYFGKTGSFYIFKLVKANIYFVETRNSFRILDGKGQPVDYDLLYSLIRDCQVLCTAHIGRFSYDKLMELGITPFIYQGDINNLNFIHFNHYSYEKA
ncbi:MAG: NifB/NifX family molybdenum-iron cluster-binding protein [Candidatus Cyclobacteriaceae bacterium M3_2C_046]